MKYSKLGLIIGLNFLICLMKVQGAYAAEAKEGMETILPTEEIKLYVGESKMFAASKPKRVAVSNSNVADILSVSEDIVVVAPKEEGTATFTFWDDVGKHTYHIIVLPEDMQAIKTRIDEIIKELELPAVHTKMFEPDEKIFLMGDVKTLQDKTQLDLALGGLKKKITSLVKVKEEDIVEIEVEVLELSKDASKTLGLTWPGAITLTEKGSPGISDTGTKWSTLFKVLNLNRAAFAWTLDALIQQGKARVLSRPRLACLSGKEADLLVGGEKPIILSQTVVSGGGQGTATEVSYKEFGIKLKIKPTVTKDGKINLNLNVDVSEPGDVDILGPANAPTAKAFPLSKRTVNTELYLNNGQTLSIGGLMKQKAEEQIVRLPFISDLPVIGKLFTKKTTKSGGGFGEKGDVELYVILTPTIVGAGSPIAPAGSGGKTTPSGQESAVKEEGQGTKPATEKESVETTAASAAAAAAAVSGGVTPSVPIVGQEPAAAKEAEQEIKPAAEEKSAETAPAASAGITPPAPIVGQEPAAAKEAEQEIKPAAEEKSEETVLPAAATAENPTDPITEYTNTVRKNILERLRYPQLAQEAGYQGKLKLRLHISSSGELLSAAVKDSSNYDLLDENALSVAKNIAAYPPFPSAIKLNELWLDIPIDYQLN